MSAKNKHWPKGKEVLQAGRRDWPEQPSELSATPCSVASLVELQTAVTEHIIEMDKVMKGPSTYERGQRIARLVSNLQEALTESQKPHNAALCDAAHGDAGKPKTL